MKRCSQCGKEKAAEEFYTSGYTRKDGTKGRKAVCKKCENECSKEHYLRHTEQARSRSRRYFTENKEKCRKATRCGVERNPFARTLRRSRAMAKKGGYAPCLATPNELAASYTGRCVICGELDDRLCADHCHKSGIFRGWLCRKCNTGLGMFRDSQEILTKAKEYLQQ